MHISCIRFGTQFKIVRLQRENLKMQKELRSLRAQMAPLLTTRKTKGKETQITRQVSKLSRHTQVKPQDLGLTPETQPLQRLSERDLQVGMAAMELDEFDRASESSNIQILLYDAHFHGHRMHRKDLGLSEIMSGLLWEFRYEPLPFGQLPAARGDFGVL